MSSPTNSSSKTKKGLIGSDHSEVDGTDDLSVGNTSDHQSTTGSIKPKRKNSSSKPVKSKSSTANNNKNSNNDEGSTRTRSITGTSSRGRKKDPQEKSKRRSSKIVATDISVNDDGDDDNDDNNTFGEYNLNDEKTDDHGKSTELGRSVRKSARKLLDKAVRAASPGRLSRSQRSKSPGVSKIGSSMRSNSVRDRSNSPSNESQTSNKSSTNKSSKSPGRLKKKVERTDSSTRSSSKRSKSPGALKKRSESPGRLKKRASSPGRKKRPQRRPSAVIGDDNKNTLGAMLDKDAESRPKRRGSRSIASEPVRKPERQKSNEGFPQRKPRSARIRPSGDGSSRTRPPTKSKSGDANNILGTTNELSENNSDDEQEDSMASSSQNSKGRDEIPSKPRRTSPSNKEEKGKEESYSNMRDELARHKIRRNKSNPIVPSPSPSQDLTEEDGNKGGDRPKVARRAESMMLHRETARRGKTSSLMDLVQYKEEEIHSTSYFASNHVLINRERMKRGLKPLSRNIAMDDLARKSAEAMAASNGLNPLQTTYVGNVLRGESIRTIHRSTMLQKQGRERHNLLNPYFEDFGVGTCKGDDGMLYMCQLFSERLQLALTDTVSEENETKPS
jgi:hypothetical protein